jgi:colanic acid/amylovoran/stewartan biosynthesis glycosyltransferase WcaL/AmsK/CpsK
MHDPSASSRPLPKVLHVVETFLDHSEVFIYNYVTAHRAWRPSVLSMFRRNEELFEAPEIFTIPYATSKRQGRWWYERAVELGTRRSSWQRRAESYVKELRPAVFHAHFGQQGFKMLTIRNRLSVPLVTTFYGYDMSVLPRERKWRDRYHELFRDGDLFLVEGSHMRARLIDLGAPPEKVQIQRIGIHVERYPRWRPVSRPTVLFVGRFREKKGLRYAIEAVGEIFREFPDLEFRIVGDGEERPAMEALVDDRGLKERATFLGMRPHAEVLEELTRAWALIHPSVTAANGDSEGGAPTILLEAQAVGVPIVSTRHADIPNIVDEKEPGIYLSDERDSDGLAARLRVALCRREGPTGTFVRELHDVSKEVSILEERYGALVRG